MGRGARVFKTQLEICDNDRCCYQTLELSLVLHPSESLERLLARLIAFALEYESGLEFGRGLSNTDEAPLWLRDPDERVLHWIEIGQPDPARMAKLNRRCERLSLYCYGANAERWWQQQAAVLAELDGFKAYLLDWPVLERLARAVERSIRLQLVRTENQLYLELNLEQQEMPLVVLG